MRGLILHNLQFALHERWLRYTSVTEQIIYVYLRLNLYYIKAVYYIILRTS